MTNNTAPASHREHLDQIRTAHNQQVDLRALTEKTRDQYSRGLLTLEELISELAVIHNTYFDDPKRGYIAVLLDCDPDD